MALGPSKPHHFIISKLIPSGSLPRPGTRVRVQEPDPELFWSSALQSHPARNGKPTKMGEGREGKGEDVVAAKKKK